MTVQLFFIEIKKFVHPVALYTIKLIGFWNDKSKGVGVGGGGNNVREAHSPKSLLGFLMTKAQKIIYQSVKMNLSMILH